MFLAFSDYEAFVFGVAVVVCLAGGARWYAALASTRRAVSSRILLAFAPPILLLGLLIVLCNWADPATVVGHWNYIALFMACGGAWLILTQWIMRGLGISMRDDAIERVNPSATITILGALLGSMIIFAWSNVGAGPTVWTTLIPAGVASAIWIGLWIFIEQATHVSDAITIDRDRASAARWASWLVASALILGRAVAGDWTSWRQTWIDLIIAGWPVLLLAILTAWLQIRLRPTPTSPQPALMTVGVIPGVALIILALFYVGARGAPSIGKTLIAFQQIK